jgi:2-polyprenyl-3-methyl-5-hydroxy-6-metoxy-1,4-benzoquinol methylase
MNRKIGIEDNSILVTKEKDLRISVSDKGDLRKIHIEGSHIIPGKDNSALFSEMETTLSVETLSKIALVKGRYFRDEIERSENPEYMYKSIKDTCQLFEIDLRHKKILDFGCGSGAFSLTLLRLGATDIHGVDLDECYLDVAESRINDFYKKGFICEKIERIDKEYNLPFPKESFDIIWLHAVLEHVLPRSRKYVLHNLWQVVKKNGLLVLDATPNRLWVKEWHTTGLYFLNYLPLRLSCSLARKFSERVPKDQSVEVLLSRGIRGCTYWGVSKILKGALCLNNLYRRKDLEVFVRNWLHKNDSAVTANIKKGYGKFMKLIDPILGIAGIPQTAFLPSHIMVFKKIS